MTNPTCSDAMANDGGNGADESVTLEDLPLDARQTLAYREWQRLSNDGDAPLQSDFRPDRIARALPAAMLLHVEREGSTVRLRQKLEGRFVVLAFGEGGGGNVEDIYTDRHLHDIMPRYLESALTGHTAMTRCTAPMRDDKLFDYTRLILPFCGPNGGVNRLLVVFHFEPVALSRLPGPLKIRREVTSNHMTVPHDAATGAQVRQAG